MQEIHKYTKNWRGKPNTSKYKYILKTLKTLGRDPHHDIKIIRVKLNAFYMLGLISV